MKDIFLRVYLSGNIKVLRTVQVSVLYLFDSMQAIAADNFIRGFQIGQALYQILLNAFALRRRGRPMCESNQVFLIIAG